MRLALECTSNNLDMIQPFADFDWILVDRYKDDETYAAWYRESTRIKFVDNSVTEKGQPCSLQDLHEVFQDCQGTYVVAPDWINDYQQTIDGYREAAEMFPAEQLVGVLQGDTPEQALQCLQTFQNSLVTVPYRVGGSQKGDPNWLMALRRQLVVAHIPADRYIHLLGFTHSSEFQWYANQPNIVSLDTDVPVRAGLVEQDIDDFDRKQNTDSIELGESNWAGICRNIALLRKAMNV